MESIAIVGMASRFPQDAASIEGFWKLIQEGRRATSMIPKERININGFYHVNSDRSDTTNVQSANFVTGDIAAFDAPFFSIQPIEAESMDPQQRILLETSYLALENAGIAMESVVGSKTAVFFAASTRDYEVMLYRDPEHAPKYMGTGIGTSLLANRVSWFFDFRGPSITIDTACSGSLTAIHLACQSLRNRESTMALVGGGALMLTPEVSMSQLSTLGFLSPDGRSYAFDSRANGYAKGEGLGMVVLKRVEDAIRDGDTIRAIIRSTSINQDGRTPGITQPSINAQAENIRHAYEAAGLNLDDTKYFETHGTGTIIGDSFEAQAIHKTFQRAPENPLYIGALKASIGHLEAGAGIAATIKSVLILENGIIPPIAGFENPNPSIPFDEWNLKLLKYHIPYPGELRQISINSFGYGGSNAHMIIQDALTYLKTNGIQGKHSTLNVVPGPANGSNLTSLPTNLKETIRYSHGHKRSPAVLLISASDKDGLKRAVEAYETHFNHLQLADKQAEAKYLQNLVYTLSNRRSNLPWKNFVVAQSLEELKNGLTPILSEPIRSSTFPTISYVFTGQGAQWAGMAQGLSVYPVFFESLQRSEEYLQKCGCEWKLLDLEKNTDISRIDEPGLSQPLCTVLQIAMVDLLESWQIRPVAVTGHSSGEIAAAYCSGTLSHTSAIQIAYYRGLVAEKVSAKRSGQGTMMAVAMSEEDIAPYLKDAMSRTGSIISVGCVNAPRNVTITGDVLAIEALKQILDDLDIFTKKLQVAVAYHSHHMKDIAGEYLASLEAVSSQILSPDKTLRPAAMFSSVTGERSGSKEVGKAAYWARNLLSKVRFSESLSRMVEYLLEERELSNASDEAIILEIGPHAALQRPVRDTVKSVPGSKNFHYESTLMRDTASDLNLAKCIGRIRCRGCFIDLTDVSSPNVPKAKFRSLSDLPAYQFNHSQSYWTESRISKSFRFREYGRHELLGVRDTDWNPLQPKWRNVIRLKEHPWIRDHKFGGQGLYPAAGMLVMAVEACRQLAAAEIEPSGYQLNNISFPAGFAINSDSETVEAQLHFFPHKAGNQQVTGWDFQIFAHVNNMWTETCVGTITMELRPFAGLEKDRLEALDLSELLRGGFANGWEKLNSSQFYEDLRACGYELGPTFQTLEELRFTRDGQATAKIACDNWTQKVKSYPEISQHVIHPTDLDAIFQSSIAAYSKDSPLVVPVLIPTKLKSLWISGDMVNRKQGQEIRILTKTEYRGYREADFSMGAVGGDDHLKILIQGFQQTSLGDQATNAEENPARSCFTMCWRPDFKLLRNAEIEDLCHIAVDPDSIPLFDLVDRQELVTLYYMENALKEIPQNDFDFIPPHLKKYMSWMKHQWDPVLLEKLRKIHPENEKLFGGKATREEFLSKFVKESPEGKLLVTVGNNVVPIITGELDALELLFGGDNMLNEYYTSAPFTACFKRLTAYIDIIAHENPALNVLEVGAGTGSLTGSVLKSLTNYTDRSDGQDDIPRLQHYTFTDISPGFFVDAKRKFAKYSNLMTYSTLNLENDPLTQGFQPAQFDIVIASLVLHATANIKRTLQNIRQILKPGGKLILFEPSAPRAARMSFVFGLLPGWWLSEEKEREWSPLLNDDGWHKALQENGFSGVDINLPDQHKQYKTFSGFISTAVDSQAVEISQPSVIVVAEESRAQQSLAKDIQKTLEHRKIDVTILPPQQFFCHDVYNKQCISLLETDSIFFEDISEENWKYFKTSVNSALGMLWVTRGCTLSASDPSRSLVTGLGRAMRCENLDTHFVELALESESSNEKVVSHIINVYEKSLLPHKGLLESEYMEQNGRLCIARVAEATSPNLRIHNATKQRQPKCQNLRFEPDRPLELKIGFPGVLESLYFDDDAAHCHQLGGTEVEIEVKAVGINFKDVLIALGQISSSTIGYECSGIVARSGPESEFQVGERVCACTPSGSYKTFVRTDASAVIRIPNSMPFNTAAGIPTVFATAYYSLVVLANIQQGESVLIHSGAGGVGQAAIQVCQRLGAEIFTTVGTEEKRELLKNLYNIPDDHIYSSRNTDFARTLMSIKKSGIDVVLNSLSGNGQRASWTCVAPLGRFIELTKSEMESSRKGLAMGPFLNNVSFHSVSLDIVMVRAKPLMRRIMSGVAELFEGHHLVSVPQPVHVYPLAELKSALRYMQGGKSNGKVVIEMRDSDEIMVLPSRRPTYLFDSNATYVIAGGLGGLGRSIVEWMADRKARYFCLLSRSGSSSNHAAKDFIQKMKAGGVHILAPRCDITKGKEVEAAIKEAVQTMPSIKGCFQGSMILKDGILDSTSAADLHAVIRPKSIGTLNLAHYLPKDMEFFVLLSSIAGMTGSRGQANYAMANTFQDAFARSMAVDGRHCISLNLGSIMSVGLAAERNLTQVLQRDGFVGIPKDEFFAILDWACDPVNPAGRDPATAQLITGLAGAQKLAPEHFRGVYWTSKPMFRPLIRLNAASGERYEVVDEPKIQNDFAAQMAHAKDEAGARETALMALVDRLADLLAVPKVDIDSKRTMMAFGIDSLIGLELRQWIWKTLQAEISVLEIMQSESVERLSWTVAKQSKLNNS